MNFPKLALFAWWCAWVSAAFGQSVAPWVMETPQQVINQRVEVLTTPFELGALPAGAVPLARIVFYRHPSQALAPQAVAVRVDGQLHTALVPGGYSTLCLPAGTLEIGIRQAQREGRAALDAPAGTTQYITFGQTDGQLAVERVAQAQALADLADLRLQSHTLSRVSAAQPCSAPASAQAPAASGAQTPATQP